MLQGVRVSRQELLKGREAMSMGNVNVQGGDISGDNQGRGSGKGVEDGEEMVRIFDVRR